MVKRNYIIHRQKKNIPNRLIAEKLNVHESTLYRWLSSEMSQERTDKVLEAIKQLKSH